MAGVHKRMGDVMLATSTQVQSMSITALKIN